jgi:hypothetical protein
MEFGADASRACEEKFVLGEENCPFPQFTEFNGKVAARRATLFGGVT